MTNLEYARRKRGWTQNQLSAVARISQSFISQIERRTGLPTPDQHARLAKALDIPAETLLDPVPPEVTTEVQPEVTAGEAR
jgi:transcriptional regulator with XRE-family HTH domain